ncbi:hypothetical protein RRG08_013717 [Elysia crispata]|uniref:Uncharacterized protein n=1 Tax=Elysia crispata TaxID=231223 RepID=A0AAE0Z894_9GAST|nr:hypothetical protein RRG08_013717 [Elysia crispata]
MFVSGTPEPALGCSPRSERVVMARRSLDFRQEYWQKPEGCFRALEHPPISATPGSWHCLNKSTTLPAKSFPASPRQTVSAGLRLAGSLYPIWRRPDPVGFTTRAVISRCLVACWRVPIHWLLTSTAYENPNAHALGGGITVETGGSQYRLVRESRSEAENSRQDSGRSMTLVRISWLALATRGSNRLVLAETREAIGHETRLDGRS